MKRQLPARSEIRRFVAGGYHLLTDVGGRRSYMVQGPLAGSGIETGALSADVSRRVRGLESPHRQMDRFREIRAGFTLQSLPFDVRKSTMALFYGRSFVSSGAGV